MTVNPVFVADFDTLKTELRLGEVPSGKDTEDLIQQALRNTRLGFWRTLGDTSIRAIKAMPLVDDPSTTNEYLRHLANETEVKWVKWNLTWVLPMLFSDDSGDADMHWNQDPTFRQITSREMDKLRKELWDTILENLDLLSGDEEAGEETTINVKTFQPEPKAFPIGNSLFHNR